MIPSTKWGRIAAAGGLLAMAGFGVAGLLYARVLVLHDPHFVVESPAAVQIAGNSHMTRAQLLSVFGGDVERNVFTIPLEQRRAELEQMPWVAHATVMRLLPNRVRVAVTERTPVAFARQGRQIGLVDANGVLLDLGGGAEEAGGGQIPAGGRTGESYSFPVLSGLSAGDPLSVRRARMGIYLDFVAALDATGEKISRKLSEVDLSNPEDVKATVAEEGSSSDILVHFGAEKYLARYRQYEQHLAEWKAQYPKLASVDMRYERQVVLEMQPGAAAPAPAAGPPLAAVAPVEPKASAAAVKKSASAASNPGVAGLAKTPPVRPPPPSAIGAAARPGEAELTRDAVPPTEPVQHLTTAFSVPSPIRTVAPKQAGVARPSNEAAHGRGVPAPASDAPPPGGPR